MNEQPIEWSEELKKEFDAIYEMVANQRLGGKLYTCDYCGEGWKEWVKPTEEGKNICFECSGQSSNEWLADIFKEGYDKQRCATKDRNPND